jgi:sec-independent protein translocase protein TatA
MLPGGIGTLEMVVIGIVAVMLFGGRLPEVAKSLGQTYAQFRKGLDDLKANFDQEMNSVQDDLPKIEHDFDVSEDDQDEIPTSPQFVPPADD